MGHDIRIQSLTKQFNDHVAVSDLNLEIPAGSIFGLLGPNGSGKTTTVRMIAGQLSIDQGSIQLGPHNVAQETLAVKAQIGVMPDGAAFFNHLSFDEHLMLEAQVRGLSRIDARQRCDDLLAYLDLAKTRHTRVAQGSMGMKKKLALALALIHRPAVLLLDEPFESLDPIARKRARELILAARDAGTTILLTSHLLLMVGETVDRFALIKQGVLVHQESLAEMNTRGEDLSGLFAQHFERETKQQVPAWLA